MLLEANETHTPRENTGLGNSVKKHLTGSGNDEGDSDAVQTVVTLCSILTFGSCDFMMLTPRTNNHSDSCCLSRVQKHLEQLEKSARFSDAETINVREQDSQQPWTAPDSEPAGPVLAAHLGTSQPENQGLEINCN